MKKLYLSAIVAILASSHAIQCLSGEITQNIWCDMHARSIKIFSECIAITNMSIGGVIVDAESFARKFETEITIAFPSTNAVRRAEYPGNIKLSYGNFSSTTPYMPKFSMTVMIL